MFKIKELRKRLNLTVKELSIKSGVATGYLSSMENDIKGVSNPTRQVMIKVANALETSPKEIFF